MEDQERDGHADKMRERAASNRVKLWVLLGADRWMVIGAVLLGLFGALVAISVAAPVPLRTVLGQSDPNETLFQALVTAIITGVTLVVTITQLVLSQELGPVGDQRERMEGAMAFREDVEKTLDLAVSPAEPAAFLRVLVEKTGETAEELTATLDGTTDAQVHDQLQQYARTLSADADSVSNRLANTQFGTFDVLFAALDFNYSWKIYEARRLRAEYGASLPPETDDALEGIIDRLSLFGPAREHIKTLYFQWELSNLVRTILYSSLPALVVATGGVLFLDAPGTVTGASLGVDNIVWVVAGATTVSLAPFVILLAYVLRIATVAKRTLAIGPLVLRETDRQETVDWDD